MITGYRLLQYQLPHNLEESANNFIAQGWQPYGFTFIEGDQYYQALVKYGEAESPLVVRKEDTTLYEDLLNA